MTFFHFYQDPAATAALAQLHYRSFKMSIMQWYHMVRDSDDWVRAFDEGLLDDTELWRYLQAAGARAIVSPNLNPYREVLVWFPNSRSRHYAEITAESYLTQPPVYNRQPEALYA